MSAPEGKTGDRLLFIVFVNLEILGCQIAYVISFFVGDHRIDKHEPRFSLIVAETFAAEWVRLLGMPALVPVRLVPEATLGPPNGLCRRKEPEALCQIRKMRTFLYECS